MGKLSVFNSISIDGYFAGPNGEIDWFKSIAPDEEFNAYTRSATSGGQANLIFGRTTYEMMHAFWPTEEAIQMDAHMAQVVDESPKLVFSRSLLNVEEEPHWKNIELRHEIDADELRRRKADRDMTILGSGSIVAQLTKLGLIDEYAFVLMPVVLGAGKTLFEGVQADLELIESRSFKNGVVLLQYRRRLA